MRDLPQRFSPPSADSRNLGTGSGPCSYFWIKPVSRPIRHFGQRLKKRWANRNTFFSSHLPRLQIHNGCSKRFTGGCRTGPPASSSFVAGVGVTMAHQRQKIAASRALASEATSRVDDRSLAMLLSIESRRIADTVESKRSLLTAIQRLPNAEAFLWGHTLERGPIRRHARAPERLLP
jgi:hypothetical protein